MSLADKVAIVRIIEEKSAQTGRTDFEFYQAYYSRVTGKVETTLWDLKKFRQTQTEDQEHTS
jgi:hypothetical protein